MCLNWRVSGQITHEWYHYAPIILEEMTEEFRSVRDCCCASPHSLHSDTSREPDQLSRVGGSVFNFLPFHVLGNITSKTKQIKFKRKKGWFCCHSPQCLFLPRFMCLTLFSRICSDSKVWRNRKREKLSWPKATSTDSLLLKKHNEVEPKQQQLAKLPGQQRKKHRLSRVWHSNTAVVLLFTDRCANVQYLLPVLGADIQWGNS